jgi:type III restriction enzyme
MSTLLPKISEEKLFSDGSPEYKSIVLPSIYSNLKKDFVLRPYQQEAFGRFVSYWNEHSKHKRMPLQLLFHMATGSGKTLIMAGLIVYLYEKGYRNFLFFVNSNNIIEKTRDNFLNTNSSKYLFSENISLGEKKITIQEVDNFQAANQDDINIVFSTIQGLHSRLNTPKENSLTYEDFEDQKIVLISDEAHHINAETKKSSSLGTEERENILSWESTVNRIFKANKENILLEFTATADLSNAEIENKYKDKIIFDYSLKQFRQDGYSKEVKVLQSDLSPFDRALQGIILNQYRRKVFEKYQQAIKPVILFKSKTIKESQVFFEEFTHKIKSLKIADLKRIHGLKSNEPIQKVFAYLETNKISLENFLLELKEDFSEEKLLSVNSKDESEQKQLAVNSLEDEANEYRAIFAVDKLNEGWDVLNLFDIVRLYDTRDAKKGKPGKTTMAEAQLIGRGARYCPFKITDEQPFYERKFDDDLKNELRICEELFYHSAYNPRYIQELNEALVEIGIKEKESFERQVKLKETFKQTAFYTDGFIFLNHLEKRYRKDINAFPQAILDKTFQVHLKSGFSKSSTLFFGTESNSMQRAKKSVCLPDLGEHILRKALNSLPFYEFSNLKELFPELNSVSEFLSSVEFLGKIRMNISGTAEQIQHLSPNEKLEVAIEVLDEISLSITSCIQEFTGSKEFSAFPTLEIIKDKSLRYKKNPEEIESGNILNHSSEINFPIDLSKKTWFVLEEFIGTPEHRIFLENFEKMYERLRSKYEDIYLIKNEHFFKIYNIENGQSVYPDFMLILSDPKQKTDFQIFIDVHENRKHDRNASLYESLNKKSPQENIFKNKTILIRRISFFTDAIQSKEFEQDLEKMLEKAR